MGSQQFCLKWKSHYSNLLSALDQLLFSESFTDVTLACEGLSLKAHRAMLSACSPFFQALFAENQCQHPIVILKDFKFSELRAIVDFMYHGEVNVSREQLSSLLKAAEALQVKGLTDLTSDSSELAEQLPSLTSSEVRASTADSASIASPSKRPLKSPPSSKRKRVRPRHVTPREQESQVSSNDEVEEDNSSEEEPSPKCSAEVPGTQRTTRSSKSSSSGSVLESLLSSKELSSCDQRRRLHASADATEDEKDFETSRLLEQALAKGDESNASIADDNCHQKMFPASSQLSLLATAKMLESGTGAKPEAEGDASTLLATLATSGESSAPGNGSGQGASHSLFPARGGRNSGWTEEQMQRALSAVFAEGVPMTAAARRFGIPKTTLLYRLQNSLTRRSPKT